VGLTAAINIAATISEPDVFAVLEGLKMKKFVVNTDEVLSYLNCLASLDEAVIKNAKAGNFRMALKCLGELAYGRDLSFIAVTGVTVLGKYGPRGGTIRINGPWKDVAWSDEFGS